MEGKYERCMGGWGENCMGREGRDVKSSVDHMKLYRIF